VPLSTGKDSLELNGGFDKAEEGVVAFGPGAPAVGVATDTLEDTTDESSATVDPTRLC